jgi:hypothetical protein
MHLLDLEISAWKILADLEDMNRDKMAKAIVAARALGDAIADVIEADADAAKIAA